MRTFKLDVFGEAIEKTKPSFKRLRDQSFATVDFDSIAEDVKKIYTRFKSLAEQTGAAKIMHFKSPRLFVMWDTEIRKRYRIPNEGPDRAHVAHDPASDKVSLRRNLSAQEAIRCSHI